MKDYATGRTPSCVSRGRSGGRTDASAARRSRGAPDRKSPMSGRGRLGESDQLHLLHFGRHIVERPQVAREFSVSCQRTSASLRSNSGGGQGYNKYATPLAAVVPEPASRPAHWIRPEFRPRPFRPEITKQESDAKTITAAS